EGSGPNAEVELHAQANDRLSILSASRTDSSRGEDTASQTLHIAEGREQTAIFKFRATDKLGSGVITFIASCNGQETKRRATLSVRPPVPYMTDVRSGSFKDQIDIALSREMHPEFRKLDATVSTSPLGLARGLDAY